MIARWWVMALAAGFFLLFAPRFFRDFEESQWQVVYVRAAQRMTAGQTIHLREHHSYAYPPAMAMMTAPVAHLPAWWSHAAWYAANALATCVVFVCCWRLAGGSSLRSLDRRNVAVVCLAVLLAGRFLISPLANTQFDMVIAAFLFAGLWQLWRGRELAGGGLIGVAAAAKCTPLLFVPYLLWRRRIKGAVAIVTAAVAMNLLPDMLWPHAGGRSYLLTWCGTFLSTLADSAPGVWLADGPQPLNQSLAGLLNRYMALAGGMLSAGGAARDTVVSPAAVGGLRVLAYGVQLALLAVTFRFFGSPFCSRPRDGGISGKGTSPQGRDRMVIEAAAVVCLMLLLSPMSSKAHFVVMLLPTMLLARLAIARRSIGWLAVATALALLGPLSAKDLWGKQLGDVLLVWGVPTWYVLVSLAALWGLLAGLPRSDAEASNGAHDARRTSQTAPAADRAAA